MLTADDKIEFIPLHHEIFIYCGKYNWSSILSLKTQTQRYFVVFFFRQSTKQRIKFIGFNVFPFKMINSKSTAPSQISCSWLLRFPNRKSGFYREIYELYLFPYIWVSSDCQGIWNANLRSQATFAWSQTISGARGKKIRLISVLTNIPHSSVN